METLTAPLGFVGLGSMGGPVAATFLAKGFPAIVHDIDPDVLAPLHGAGATEACSPLDVANAAQTVFVCLPTLESIRHVVLGPQGLRHGRSIETCVNLSTTGPAFIRDLARDLGESSIRLMDCPITGGAAAARAAQLSVTVSGHPSSFNAIRPLLEQIAAHVFYVGAEPGQAQLMKLLNNMLSFAAFVAACEAFALGVKAGLDPDTMVDVINTGTGRNSATTYKFPRNILPRTFDYGAKMMISYKDIKLFLDEAERYGVPTWLAPVIKQVIGYAITQDGDGNDVSTLIRHYEKWCNIEVAGKAASVRL